MIINFLASYSIFYIPSLIKINANKEKHHKNDAYVSNGIIGASITVFAIVIGHLPLVSGGAISAMSLHDLVHLFLKLGDISLEFGKLLLVVHGGADCGFDSGLLGEGGVDVRGWSWLVLIGSSVRGRSRIFDVGFGLVYDGASGLFLLWFWLLSSVVRFNDVNFQNDLLLVRFITTSIFVFPELLESKILRYLEISRGGEHHKSVFEHFWERVDLRNMKLDVDGHFSAGMNNALNRFDHEKFRLCGFDLIGYVFCRFISDDQLSLWWVHVVLSSEFQRAGMVDRD